MRGGKVHVVITSNIQQNIVILNIQKTIAPDSIVYTSSFLSYDALDVSELPHRRINDSEIVFEARNHISGVENF